MTTFERINMVLEDRGIVPAQMMKAIGASAGLFSQWRTGMQKPSADKVVKIADYLDCSVDYLLGRTDNKEMNITITAAPTISRTGELSTTTTGGIEHITINEDTSETAEEKEILQMIKSLSAVQKARIILMIDEMTQQKEKTTNTTP